MKKRKNILFIVSRLPINTETGDRLRVYHFIRKLQERGHQVDIIGFVPQGDYTVRTDIEALCHQCVGIPKAGIEFENTSRLRQLQLFFQSFWKGYPFRVWQWYDETFLQQALELISYHKYDAVHFSEASVGYVLDAVKNLEHPPLIVYDLIDSVALSLKNSLDTGPLLLRPFRYIEYKRLRNFELEIAGKADQTVLISERDKKFLQKDEIQIIPNGIVQNTLGERTRDIDLLFVGNLAAEPNADAATWFAADIMPHLLKEKPDLKFYIVGANPPEAIKNLENDHVVVTGFVQNINEYYRQAKLFVCPMRQGAGQKNKLLEAMINNAPVVSTPEGNIGVDAPEHAIALADDEMQFRDRIISLLHDDTARRELAENGYTYAKSTFSWDSSCTKLEQCYEIK